MDKVKIHEIAEEAGIPIGELIEKAKELDLDVKAANSTISFDDAGILVEYAISGNLPAGFKKQKKETKPNTTEMEEKKMTTENDYEKKKQELQRFLDQIKEERDKLKREKDAFEAYKKSEESKLKEKFTQDEIDHKAQLEDLKIKTISKLKEDFLKNIQSEFDKVNSKLDEITQKELKLMEWQQTLDDERKKFEKEKELFESNKQSLLNTYKEELEKDKEIFHNQLEEERVKKLEEINQKIEQLYADKANEIEVQTEKLREKEAVLKTQIAEVEAKEKRLESQSELIYRNEKEKVGEEIKTYKTKIEKTEIHNQALREELADLREELNSYEKFEDRDLPMELEEKQEELIRLKKRLDDAVEQKNKVQVDYENSLTKYDKEKDELLKQIQILRTNIKETDALRSQNALLNDKMDSKEKHIEFLEGEKRQLEEKLHAIFSQGKEKDLRVEDIKRVPYKEVKLENEISIKDEIKYLDSIEEYMEQYGVKYPKRLLYAFHTAIKSADLSPLTVLSGVSGTGKSELPKLYSHFGGFNFLAEAVQPTWDSPESMMGYYNTIENKFDSTNILKFLLQTSQSRTESPFGLKESMNMILLDEMNLAHIELYFAEFLSKFELRRGSKGVNLDIKLGTGMNYQLPLDRNILWIGTMNEDETTKSLSDKVLDRAFSINFPRPDSLLSRNKLPKLDEIKPFEYLHRDTWNNWIQNESLFTGEKSEVLHPYREIANEINKHLEPTGKAIGHRVWQSIEYYTNNHPLVIENIDNDDELIKKVKLAFEEQLVQKIMPKLRGIEVHGIEKQALDNIRDILNQNDFSITEDFELSMDNSYGQFIWNSANYLKED